MENRKNKKPNKLENKLATIKKTALGLFLFATLALSVSACEPQGLPYYSEPATNKSPSTQQVEEIVVLNSVDETTLDPLMGVTVSRSTPLEMRKANGVITSIAPPPLPCGEPSTITSPDNPPILYRNEREELCHAISSIAETLEIPIDQKQIEMIASQIIIVTFQDNQSICDIGKAGCYLPIPEMIILYDTSDMTIIHEKTHAINLSDDKHLDVMNNACFLYDYSQGGFTMVYENLDSSTGFSVAYISKELFPSLFEQLLIQKRQEENNQYYNYPVYLVQSNMTEEQKIILKQKFDSLNFSQADFSFILIKPSITMMELFQFLKNVSGPPKKIAELAVLFSENMASQGFELFSPISDSTKSPIQACQ